MKDEIKVGEWVRTKRGVIDKVDALYEMIENTVHLENQKWFNTKNIVKHSSNIINLIECGDYVNGHEVLKKEDDNFLIIDDKGYTHLAPINIKSIVTHEQFKSIEYTVKE